MNMSRETLPELLITVTRFHDISMTKKRSIRYLAEKCFDREKNANEVTLVKGKAGLFVVTRKNCKWYESRIRSTSLWKYVKIANNVMRVKDKVDFFEKTYVCIYSKTLNNKLDFSFQSLFLIFFMTNISF